MAVPVWVTALALGLHIVEELPSYLHLLPFRALIVVLIENVAGYVHPIANDFPQESHPEDVS
jgi:hypothetical protein